MSKLRINFVFLLLVLTYFTLFSSVSIADLEYVNVSWVKTIQMKKKTTMK